MIAKDRPRAIPGTPRRLSSVAQGSEPSECLALVRVFVAETSEHADSLGRYLRNAGHPHVLRSHRDLPAVVGRRAHAKSVFELFVLPIDLGPFVASLNTGTAQIDVDSFFDLTGLPLLMIERRRQPLDPQRPEVELLPILDQLPTWHPHGPAPANSRDARQTSSVERTKPKGDRDDGVRNRFQRPHPHSAAAPR